MTDEPAAAPPKQLFQESNQDQLIDYMRQWPNSSRPFEAGAAPTLSWAEAIRQMANNGEFETLLAALPQLVDAFPDVGFFRGYENLLSTMPADDGSPFVNERTSWTQLVPFEGADTLLVVFTSTGDMGAPVAVVHRWFRSLGVHILYLRERLPEAFMRGVGKLSYSESLIMLRKTAERLGVRRTLCLGFSNGGYGSLRYALDRGAAAALAYSATTFIPADEISQMLDDARTYGIRAAQVTELEGMDLRTRLLEAAKPPAMRVVFSSGHERDREQAEHIADMPRVMLDPVPRSASHDSIRASIRTGLFEDQLRWLVSEHG